MGLTGWYVHHHGAGHVTRFLAVRPHLAGEVVVFSSMPAPAMLPPATRWVLLNRDDDRIAGVPAAPHAPDSDGGGPDPLRRPDSDGGGRDDGRQQRTGPPASMSPADADPTVGGLLHWAPLGHRGHASRFAVIAGAVAAERFDRFVVDVSVEVALLVRLLGVATVVVTQPGDRTDGAHLLAYRAATRVLAPWPAGAHPAAVDRLVEVGGVSRFEGRVRDLEPEPGTVLVLGGGVVEGDLEIRVAAAAAATPGTRWRIAGGAFGWLDDPWEALQRAEVVVAAAGQNSVADLAAARARAVVIPQPRPFDEQAATGRVLAERGLAVVVPRWPDDAEWPAVLDRARRLRPDWSAWGTTGAARRAADAIAEVGPWTR